MRRILAWELGPALLVMALITAGYAWLAREGLPAPGSRLGHGIGIAGFSLMLGAQTLHTLRKRMRAMRGKMVFWMRAHIFLGLVGGCLAVLHSAGKFHGLAGVLTMATIAIVLSGIVGRFIYSAVPRTAEGAELGAETLAAECAAIEHELAQLGVAPTDPRLHNRPPGTLRLLLLGRWILHRAYRNRLRRVLGRGHGAQVRQLLEARHERHLALASLAATRRVLAYWHLLHVPLGILVFTLALLHIGWALYFSSPMR